VSFPGSEEARQWSCPLTSLYFEVKKEWSYTYTPPSTRLHWVDRENICKLMPVRFVGIVTNDICTSLRTNEVCRSRITHLNSVLQVQICLFALSVLLIAKLHALDEYVLRRNIHIYIYIYIYISVCIFTCWPTYNPCLIIILLTSNFLRMLLVNVTLKG